MKRKMLLCIRSFFSLIHITFTKIFNIGGFFSAPVQDFSASTKFSISGGGKIFLKKHIHTKRNVCIEADGGIVEIGEGCFFNNGCMIVSKERVRIGSCTAFGPNVFVYDHDHDIKSGRILHESGFLTDEVIIGDNVWIGANCVILRGTRIGDGVVVGAGSVLKGVYEPGSVIIQKRSEEVRKGVHSFD